MIIFEGNISGQCLNNYNKKLRNEILVAFSAVTVIVVSVWYFIFGISWLMLTPIAVCSAMYAIGLTCYKNASGKPFKITIDTEEGTVVCKRIKEKELFAMIENVHNVYDFGEYYHLWEAGDMFLCQKNLLTKGNLEEFEKIFEGKIIRKY